jgi:hypothetical protein
MNAQPDLGGRGPEFRTRFGTTLFINHAEVAHHAYSQ